jgi:hypothetical protein
MCWHNNFSPTMTFQKGDKLWTNLFLPIRLSTPDIAAENSGKVIWRQSQCRPWCSPKPDSQLEPRLNHLRSHRNSCTVHLRRCKPGGIWYKRLCNWCVNTFHFCIAFHYPLLATYRYKVNLYFLSLGIIGS